MKKHTWLIVLGILGATATATVAVGQVAEPGPLTLFTTAWRDDAVWYDGQAEVAVYDATRTIYGKLRHYQAVLYTNKEKASPVTFTKSGDDSGREVFKHHLREDIATENYDYHFSTMAYVGTTDLKSLKLDMGSQEDCGSTFKQYINHAQPGQASVLSWEQYTYFPDEGHKRGAYKAPDNLVFVDALSLILRGYRFGEPGEPGELPGAGEPGEVSLMLIVDQRSNKLTDPNGVAGQVRYVGLEEVDVPAGVMDAHHLRLTYMVGEKFVAHDYWFAAAPKMLHVMVRYEGSGGQSYRLRSLERRAYWRR